MNTANLRYHFIVRNMRMMRTCPHLFRHVTPQDMIREFDPTDLAQLANHQQRAQIDGDLLVLGIGNFPLNVSVEQQLAVSNTIRVICDACAYADTLLTTALHSHYRYKETLVFTNEFLHLLKLKGLDIAHYRLYDAAPPDVVKERYAAAIDWLKLLETGQIKLLTIPPLQESYAYFSAKARAF